MNKDNFQRRYYILLSTICLSLILGLVVLFRKAPTPLKDKWDDKTFNIFQGKQLSLIRKGIVVVNVSDIIQYGARRGMLGIENYGVSYLINRINYFAKQKKVKGMILRINSPGGTIGAVQELYNAIIDFRKQGKYVIASMADIAASGGYYIAAACDEIYANPGTMTGSIGVIIMAPSLKGLFNKIGISYNVFKSGKHKDILSSHRNVTPEERRILQSVVDSAYKQFFTAVKKSRKIDSKRLRLLADGRIFTGEQAKKYKLIDGLGDLKTVKKVIGKKTELGENPEILEEKVSPFELLLSKLERKQTLTEKVFDLYAKKNINIFYLYMP